MVLLINQKVFLLSAKSQFKADIDFSIIASFDLKTLYEVDLPILLFDQITNGNIALVTQRQPYLHKNKMLCKLIYKEDKTTIDEKFAEYQSNL